jgi:hypothetical protein
MAPDSSPLLQHLSYPNGELKNTIRRLCFQLLQSQFCPFLNAQPRKQITVPSHPAGNSGFGGQKSSGPVALYYESVSDLPSWIGGKAVLEASNACRSHFRKTR